MVRQPLRIKNDNLKENENTEENQNENIIDNLKPFMCFSNSSLIPPPTPTMTIFAEKF